MQLSLIHISKDNGRLEVLLKKQSLEADLVLLSVGVKPESALARAAGLKLNAKGGIITDSHMLTSDPDIYAVGDAVEVRHFVTGQPAMIALACLLYTSRCV